MNEEFKQLCKDLGLWNKAKAVMEGKETLITLLLLVIVEQGKQLEEVRQAVEYL